MKVDWPWKKTYDELYNNTKALVKKGTCMKFYNERQALYLETDMSGVGLGASLLQVRESMNCTCDEAPNSIALCPIAFASKAYPVWKTYTVTLRVRKLAYTTD